jgi:hypothetical protein
MAVYTAGFTSFRLQARRKIDDVFVALKNERGHAAATGALMQAALPS